MGIRVFRTLAVLFDYRGWNMQTRLVVIFLLVKVIPLILLAGIAWRQFLIFGSALREIAVNDSTASLNDSAVKNIERMTTDTARRVAAFLYARDADIRYAATLEPSEAAYAAFIGRLRRRVVQPGRWELSVDGNKWENRNPAAAPPAGVSRNSENNDRDGFHAIPASSFPHVDIPLYDEMTFVAPDGRELVKVVASDTSKRRYRPDPAKKDVSLRENTYVKAETYFPKLRELNPGEIYVSDVIGAYQGTNYIGIYTAGNVAAASKERGYAIAYEPDEQAYAGRENPNGRRFEGIVRWATPVAGDDGQLRGYVTLALNHDHIMEFVDRITPMEERYVELPSAFEGNYAFIWDYQCRNIAHPRHHSIVGFDPGTGEPEVPWLETSIYEGWRRSGVGKWTDYVKDIEPFQAQSRKKKAAFDLTRAGQVGLDGRYLNNAPQCTGWMDLTEQGGSGSFYIVWSDLHKLTTAAAIPYYTGQYAPSPANKNSRRGFGFVTIGAGLEDFALPAEAMAAKLEESIADNMQGILLRLFATTFALTVAVVFIAFWMARDISRPVRRMAEYLSRLADGDIVDVDVVPHDRERSDEIGTLARSLHELVLARRSELETTHAVADGDYTQLVPLKSEYDLLGKALNGMIRTNKQTLAQVNRVVGRVGDGVGEMSDVSVSLAQGVQTSETVLGTISSAVSHVDQQAQENASRAREISDLAIDNREAARRGYEAASGLAAAMEEIQQSGRKIASVAKLIDDIAFQTNLLALNAAVEAARAGRYGKGFSVVAEEVRSLSARSARAAHETGEMVEGMLKSIEAGAQMAGHSDQEFRQIVESAGRSARLIENVVEASTEQSSSTSRIVRDLGQIDEVTRENSRNARQMAHSAGALHQQAEELRRLVAHFRLDSDARDGTAGRRPAAAPPPPALPARSAAAISESSSPT